MRGAVARRRQAQASQRLERERDQATEEAYEADRQALLERLAHAGERMLELLTATPGGGKTESIVVEHRSFRGDLTAEGWLLDGDVLFPPRAVLVPDGTVLYCELARTSNLAAVVIKKRGSLRDWADRKLVDAEVELDNRLLQKRAPRKPVKPTAMSKREVDHELRQSLSRVERRVMDTYVRILDQAGVDLSAFDD